MAKAKQFRPSQCKSCGQIDTRDNNERSAGG